MLQRHNEEECRRLHPELAEEKEKQHVHDNEEYKNKEEAPLRIITSKIVGNSIEQ